MENNSKLLPEEIEHMNNLVEKYRTVYTQAVRLGKQIEDLQGEMLKVTAIMNNISNQENDFYKEVGDRLDLPVEEARTLILEEIQKNMNQMQN